MCNTIFTASCHWQLWLPWWRTAPSYSKYSRSCQAAQSKVKRSCSARISPFDCHANEAVLTSAMRRGYHREEGSICCRFTICTRQRKEMRENESKTKHQPPHLFLLFYSVHYFIHLLVERPFLSYVNVVPSLWLFFFPMMLVEVITKRFVHQAFFFLTKLWEVTVRGRLAGQCVILTSTSALLLVKQHMTIPLLQRLPPTLFLFSCV